MTEQTPDSRNELINSIGRATEGARDTLTSNLATWTSAAQGAYAPNTHRAWRADWRVFASYCAQQDLTALPAAAETVQRFVEMCGQLRKRPATIRRYLATITRAHAAARCEDPCRHELVRLSLPAAARTMGVRQRPALGLTRDDITHYLAIEPTTLRDHRDRALISLGYDAMLRREEIVAVIVSDLHFDIDGSGTLLIPSSKTDAEGEGAVQYLAPDTVTLIKRWLDRAGIEDGIVFRRIVGQSQLGLPLQPAAVTDVVRRVAKWIGLPSSVWPSLSGHSLRVGATQDMIAHNLDLSGIMQSGRWRDSRMPVRYGQHLAARRSAARRLAALQGRENPGDTR